MNQQEVSGKNSEFWNELCGTQLAKSLGISDSSAPSLKKFDDWYFQIYPYLSAHIPFPEMKGKRVLEVGLGYGTLSQKLAESGALYTGLDIATGPVNMVNHRLGQQSLSGKAIQGSILDQPFPENSFDFIIAIGCLHHTGNLELAVEQCRKMLRPGGSLIFMVYYAYSYRRFRMVPSSTFKYVFRELMGYRGVVGQSASTERAAYDTGANGQSAPHTDWISSRSLEDLCKNFSKFSSKIENIEQEMFFRRTARSALLNTRWPSIVGLDLYAKATK